jgi:hypothetical protein
MTQQSLTASQETKGRRVALDGVSSKPVQSFQTQPHPILRLHTTLGNRRVAQLIQAKRIAAEGKITGFQRKLTGAAHDQFERKAARVAKQATSISDTLVDNSGQPAISREEDKDGTVQARILAHSHRPMVQEQLEADKDSEEKKDLRRANRSAGVGETAIQRHAQSEEQAQAIERNSAAVTGESSGVEGNLETQIGRSKGQGSPLPDPVRAYMEPRFGADFSDVRVHTGREAQQMSRSVFAQAFTHGSDIYFGEGHNPTELALTAHELTHIVQQSGAREMGHGRPIGATTNRGTVLSRFPNAVTFGTYEPGLAIIPPVVKEGYDGSAHTAIKLNWGLSSWERRWRVYDAEDNLLYDSSYTYPHPNLDLSKDIIAKGKAGGKDKPWSVWHEVTETEIPFGGSNPDNFPYAYMKFNVFETWNDFMADPEAKAPAGKQIGKPGKEPGKPSPVESSTAKNVGSVIDYGSTVAMHEAYLRQIYDKAASGITATAEELVSKGVPQTDVAKWANEARNVLKVKVRTDGNAILEKVFESRNLAKYGNKIGPSYEQLVAKYSKQGLSPEEIDARIIKGAGKANVEVNKWSGRLRVAGKITLFVDIAFAGVRVYLAPEGERTKVALEEVARIGGALGGGALGTEAGAAVGGAIGAAFGGVGAVPGAIIGGMLGGLGGALLGGWAGRSAVDAIYDLMPPSDCVFEGEYQEETH